MKKPQIRCIHRHTIDEHPVCFAKGLINYEFANDREWEKLTGKNWYTFPGYKIGYFDIEVDNLNADFGSVLTWCIKEKDGKILSSVITRDELVSKDNDKRIVQDFVNTLKEFKIIVGYYSDRFDMPYMRAKALHYGIEFPGYGELFHWDLYYTVKAKLKISSRSLDNTCNYLGIVGKTPLDKNIWRAAKYGDPKAIKEVLHHNEGDVIITEQLHEKVGFTRKWIRRSI